MCFCPSIFPAARISRWALWFLIDVTGPLFPPRQRHIVVDTFFGYDEESMDSETSSVASLRMDRTPATPDEDLEMVRPCFPAQSSCPRVPFKRCWLPLVPPRACPTRSRSCVSVSWPESTRPYSGPTPCCRSRRAAFWMQKWRQRYWINSHLRSEHNKVTTNQ